MSFSPIWRTVRRRLGSRGLGGAARRPEPAAGRAIRGEPEVGGSPQVVGWRARWAGQRGGSRAGGHRMAGGHELVLSVRARVPNVHDQPNQERAAQPSRAAGVFAVRLVVPEPSGYPPAVGRPGLALPASGTGRSPATPGKQASPGGPARDGYRLAVPQMPRLPGCRGPRAAGRLGNVKGLIPRPPARWPYARPGAPGLPPARSVGLPRKNTAMTEPQHRATATREQAPADRPAAFPAPGQMVRRL